MSLVAGKLTDGQIKILELARDGLTGKEMAAALGISYNTIAGQLADARQRLNALNTTQAVIIAIRCGYIAAKAGGKNEP